MGMRETLAKYTWVVTLLVLVAVGVAIWVVIGQLSGGSGNPDKAYYTNDDGKTYFTDDAKKVPPFDKGGQPAYRAYVVKCGDGKPYVAYMERLTDQYKEALEKMKSRPKDTPQTKEEIMQFMQATAGGGRQVKKPGDKEWNPMSPQFIPSRNCPDGSQSVLVRP